MWPLLYLPKGKIKYEKLSYAETDIAVLFRELSEEQFSGSVEIVSPSQRGLFVWHSGNLHQAFYDGDDEQTLERDAVLQHFLQKKRSDSEMVINVTELDAPLIESLSALNIKAPMYRELETSFIDMARLFDTLGAKRFLGVLRFYHIRSHTRLGNILIKMNKITRDQLQQAVRLQLSQQGALRLGDALVQIGAIEPKDLGSALDLQSHARKGSDIELALAVFWEGKLLGGYTHIHKQFKIDRDEILPQLVGTEVLMDMLEGQLTEPMDIAFLWKTVEHHAPEGVEKTHQAVLHPEAGPSQERRPHADDNLNLRADDLILDIALEPLDDPSDFLTMDSEEEKAQLLPSVAARPAIPPMAVKPPASAPIPASTASRGMQPKPPAPAASVPPPVQAVPSVPTPAIPTPTTKPTGIVPTPPSTPTPPVLPPSVKPSVPKGDAPAAAPVLPASLKPSVPVPPVAPAPVPTASPNEEENAPPMGLPITPMLVDDLPEPPPPDERESPVRLAPEVVDESPTWDESLPVTQETIPADVTGVEYALYVAREFMGAFGVSLLKKEAAPLPLQGREWPENQVRDLVQRFLRSSVWLLGLAQAEAMQAKMRERIEV